MAKHYWDQIVDALCGALGAKVKRVGRSERFAEDHDGLDVCVFECLRGE